MAILKDLIVHGASHFIGKTFINDSHIAKINESNVPENPKFTDTIATGEVDGTGNVITNVTVDNSGSFTFTKERKVIGKNLLKNTAKLTDSFVLLSRASLLNSEIIRITPNSSAGYAKFRVDYLNYADFEGSVVTISLDVRIATLEQPSSYTTENDLWIYLGVQTPSRIESSLFGASSDCYKASDEITGLTSSWQRKSFTFKIPDDLTTGQTALLVAGNYLTVQFAESKTRSPIEIRHIKLEIGDSATDWEEDFLNYVTPQMFGAYGDGEHDDTIAIQNALDASFNVFLPAGTYMISHSLIVRSKTHLYGESTTSSKIQAMRSFNNTNFPTDTALNIKRKAFLTENETSSGTSDPHAESYMIQIIQSIRASSDYCEANTRNVTRQGFVGATSHFLLENFSLDCNDVTDLEIANPSNNSNTPVALGEADWNIGVCKVGGMHIWRPYDQCVLRNIYCYNTTVEGLLVGDRVSYAFMQKHYLPWIDKEPTIPDEDSVIPEEEQREYLEQTIKMLRRRTRGQTLQIQNCHFLGSSQGNTFNPLKYYDRSTLKEADSSSGNYLSYRKIYWRPAYGIPYRWVNIDSVYNFNKATSLSDSSIPSNRYNSTIYDTEENALAEANKYGAVTTSTATYTHNKDDENKAVSFTWTKKRVWANKWISYQRTPLVYIYNCFETNLMNTKIMFRSSNIKPYPALVLDNCSDVFVRGCSFTGTVGPALRIVGTTNYYRLIGNTYEITGVISLNSGVFTGYGFATQGVHNFYNTSVSVANDLDTTSDGILNNLSYKGPKGEAPNDTPASSYNEATPLFPEAPYVIDLLGLPAGYNGTYSNPSNQTWKVTNGIILEATYNNTPKEVRCRYTKNTLLMGSFTRSALTSTEEEGTIIIDTQTGKITSDKFNTIKYDIATSQYSSVSSGGYSYRAIRDISSDMDKYGTPVGITIATQTGSPATVVRRSKELYIYTTSNTGAVSVTVKYEP